MALTVGRRGFGQVEPNHLSGIVTGQIYAQLPVDTAKMGNIIENGRFAKYDYATGKVTTNGTNEWLLIYNEEKLYDERLQSHKDFAMIDKNYTDKEMVPRLIRTYVGDIFTTNCFGANTTGANTPLDGPATTKDFDVAGISLSVGDPVTVGADGYLAAGNATGTDPEFVVVKEYTMADGQPGVKLQRVK